MGLERGKRGKVITFNEIKAANYLVNQLQYKIHIDRWSLDG